MTNTTKLGKMTVDRRNRMPKHRVPNEIRDQIILLARTCQSWSASRIHEEIAAMLHSGSFEHAMQEDVPTKRTVQRMVNDYRGPLGEPWTYKDSTGEDARIIVNVLRSLIINTMGEKTSLTKAEAEWVLRLGKVFPNMKPGAIWILATTCLTREAMGEEPESLTSYLAMAPMRDALAELDPPRLSFWDPNRFEMWGKSATERLPATHQVTTYQAAYTPPRLIRELHERGLTTAEIAELGGVAPWLIEKIVGHTEVPKVGSISGRLRKRTGKTGPEEGQSPRSDKS
jgi:hypothetical protein